MSEINRSEFEILKSQVEQLKTIFAALNEDYILSIAEISQLTADSVIAADNAARATFHARDAALNCYNIVLENPSIELISSVALVLATAESAAKAAVEAAAAAAAASAAASRAAARQAIAASAQLAVQAAESSKQAAEAAAQAVRFSQDAASMVKNAPNSASKSGPDPK
jgi:hypothetical protein